eukprot:m.60273 g.60273  ORF g.60273 m.60273 type:complete len:271 (-) comp16078_c0_seq2:43-855(-)
MSEAGPCVAIFVAGATLSTWWWSAGTAVALRLLSLLALGGAAFAALYVLSSRQLYKPTSFALGLAMGTSIFLLSFFPSQPEVGLYCMVMTFFHFSEFVTVALFCPHKLSFNSFLLNHSREYGIAALAGLLEYSVEVYFFPGLKHGMITLLGLGLVVVGELFRLGAMWTARSNFSHVIADTKEPGHTLVTHGVYGWSRHPSYVGWFIWSVGTQVLLCNPICTVGYAVATISFFRDRVPYEEMTLLRIFGKEYEQYQQRVPVLIPFVEGYIL